MPARIETLKEWVDRYLAEEEPRSKSLMVSVLGDSVAPYAPGLWLSDLITLMSALGLNERLVRTSAFRLIDEGWLTAEKRGRRSYYALTRSGTQRFKSAYQHIYRPPPKDWDGHWTLVVIQRNNEPTPERSELRRDLEWEGFTLLANGVFAHPTASAAATREVVARNSLDEKALVFRASADGDVDDSAARILASWNLEEVRLRYAGFLKRFSPLEALLVGQAPRPVAAFQVQTLMIHSFRRANLHDPRLPLALLPPQWPGEHAFELCRRIYARTCRLAHQHVGDVARLDTSIAAGVRLDMPVSARFNDWMEPDRHIA